MNSSKNKVKFLARAYFFLLPWSRPKRLWALAALLLLLFLSFQYLISHWQAVLGPLASGEEIQLLDAQFGLKSQEIIPLLAHLGPVYRQEQSYLYMSLDLIYPFAYGLFFSAWLLFLLQNSFPRYLGSLYQGCFFPFLISITDLLENISFILLLWRYPRLPAWLWSLASFFNQAKWIGVNLLLIFLLLGYIARWMNRVEVAEFKAMQKRFGSKNYNHYTKKQDQDV